jgi:SAM-dependent methyltransferase
MLAHQVLVTCGPGRVLDVGCGMGELVRMLLGRGVDAQGVDIAGRPVAHAEALAPGRFAVASVLELPFEEGSFETVVCTDCLEHLSEDDVPRAIAEIARVARRSVFLTIGTRADRDGKWHLTVRDRAWWEQRLLAAGLRKHPAAPGILPYEALEAEGPSVTVVLEKIPTEAATTYPLQSLREGRGLHMDMLRESGRRSDAHIARYAMAAGYVRRGDVVLDAACGLGYGAAVLSRMSPLSRVIGIDNDAAAVEYARANFGPSDPRCEFRAGDCEDLSALEDASVDMVVSFETLEHLANPERFVGEVRRVLRPGGRFIASVPNDWTDETGKDPNPHHLHVYTWEKLARQVGEGPGGLLLERAYAQTAGGGMKCASEPRRMTAIKLDERGALAGGERVAAEWWLVVAMKPVTDGSLVAYAEHAPSRGQAPDFNPLAFAPSYRNPWLGDAMVMIGHRATDAGLLERMAKEVLGGSPVGTPDTGAALCVLAYRMLEAAGRPAAEVEGVLERLAAFDLACEDGRVADPHMLRWRISNRFVAGRLLLAIGHREEAGAMFARCAELDPTPFSPLLASKTVEALWHTGLIAAGDGDMQSARASWERGLNEARRVLAGDWRQIWDSPSNPAPFALLEIGAIADAGAMCSAAINGIDEWGDRPGRVWRSMHAGTKTDYRSWIAHLERSRSTAHAPSSSASRGQSGPDSSWLEQQLTNWRGIAEQREGAIVELKSWTDRLTQARTWLEGQVNNWKAECDRRSSTISQLKAWTEQLTTGKGWLEEQLTYARGRLDDAERRASEAEAAAAEATTRLGQRACEHAAEVVKLQTAVGDSRERLRELNVELADARAALKRQDEVIRAMRTPGGVLRTGADVILRKGRRDESKAAPGGSGSSGGAAGESGR